MTPYHLAVRRDMPQYYLRLLLRAAPEVDRNEYHALNYQVGRATGI